jgi:hypothetical protein
MYFAMINKFVEDQNLSAIHFIIDAMLVMLPPAK